MRDKMRDKMNLFIEDNCKKFRSNSLNFDFNMENGDTKVWGENEEIDPVYSPYGNMILDIEVSTICSMNCSWCYKSNLSTGKHMSFDTFKKIIDKLPKYNNEFYINQIALGIGNVDASDELWKMMEYCRENKIIPNITINGDRLTDKIVEKLVKLCGAVSVSCYKNKDLCYNAVKKLTEAGLKQVNIHQLVSNSTYKDCFQVIYDAKNDERLKNLNAIVFLSLKQKGRGINFEILPYEKYKNVICYALNKRIKFGSDSCGCKKLSQVFKDLNMYNSVKDCLEPCESNSFSYFIDVDGVGYPCSFANEHTKGINILEINDFLKDVWFSGSTCKERKRIGDNNRNCLYFNV